MTANLSPENKIEYDMLSNEIAELHRVMQANPMPTSQPYGVTPKELLNHFIAHSAKLNFLLQVQYILAKNNGWDIPSIENELRVLDEFRMSALLTKKTDNQTRTAWADESKQEYYQRFVSGYYEYHYMPVGEFGFNEAAATVYGQYILLCDYLRKKVDSIYQANIFCTFSPNRRIDEVLTVMKEHQTIRGLGIYEVFKFLEHKGYLCPYVLLTQMFQKLERDGYIYNHYSNNALTFNGSIFVGYDIDETKKINAEESEKKRETSLIYATWAAGIATSLLVLFEVYKLFPRWMPLLAVLYLLFAGGAIGIATTIVIPRLGEGVRRWLNK